MNTPCPQDLASRSSIIQKSRKILDFWHKVEFFIPYDLEKQILDHEDKDWAVRRITAKHLASIQPQSSGDLWKVPRVPAGKRLSGFELYLGIFDKELLSRLVRTILPNQPSELEDSEDFERGDYEGLTCFAKVALNALGEPQWDKVSVSTVPWALGRLKSFGLGGLDFEDFRSNLKTLQHELADFQTQRLKDRSAGAQKDGAAPSASLPLVRAEIEQLVKIFCSWADFTPDSSEFPVVVIRALAPKESKKKDQAAAKSPKPNSPSRGNSKSPSTDNDDPDDDVETDDQIDILNSFYARDIQRVLRSLTSDGLPPPLLAYLAPVPASKQVSVYSEDGGMRIRARLHPNSLPRGHWLGEPGHYMSLMQQFAINEAAEATKARGIFSVNGPPGTGKTTLLRDIFAEIITQRASVLAALPNARDAFEAPPDVSVEFKGGDTRTISRLKQKLTGFEIVVASTNNAAVENISRDLPKASALGSQKAGQREELTWRRHDGTPKCTYLQTVAARYAARNDKGQFDQLSVDDSPWGLIAGALGSQANRRRFWDGVFGKAVKDGEDPPKGYDPQLHKSIWEWCKNYKGPSFSEAADQFRKAEIDVSNRQAQLAEYVDALEKTAGLTLDGYTSNERHIVDVAEAAWQSAQADLQSITAELAAVSSQLESIDRLRLQNEKPRVSALRWLFSGEVRRNYSAATIVFDEKKQRIDAMETGALLKKIEFEQKLPSARSASATADSVHQAAKKHLKQRTAQWNKLRRALKTLGPQFPEIEAQWQAGRDIEDIEIQIDGLWPDPQINLLRSKLFAAALSLHEAWLAEVSKPNGWFRDNLFAISSLLYGYRLLDPDHAKLIWQSLFMIVPVVSSTFASIANQFQDLGAGSLGWLFIDEAGQAVPQAAVGALWRSQKAMVVGDPLQIEPVFTVPAKLIEELEKSSGITQENVAPHKRSVQNLADDANIFGAEVPDSSTKSKKNWIGSPLRVHRRCADPMFSIANEIAYQGKMIFAAKDGRRPPGGSLNLGDSAWVQISGTTENKQVVPEQVELVMEGLVALARSIGGLPPVYVISPFRRIASTLRTKLADVGCWSGVSGSDSRALTKSAVRKWCKSHIGTVHTFQGKQASVVWMVLGCDEKSEGAVTWASRKPNILNVALTRAEHRFFMIGDFDVWGGREYFCYLVPPEVVHISPMDFMGRIESVQSRASNKKG